MSRMSVAVAAFILALAPGFSAAAVVVGYSFDSNNQGWTAGFGADRSSSATWSSGANPGEPGNPAGHLRASDRNDFSETSSAVTWYFSLSGQPRTDRSAAYGGTLTYDIMTNAPAGTGTFTNDYDVVLLGTVGFTGFRLGFSSSSLKPTTTYATKSVPLLASAGWKNDNGFIPFGSDPAATEAELLAVLRNLTGIEIRGNYFRPFDDNTGLDNVALNTVPEPGSIIAWTILATAVGFGYWLRVRCNRSGANQV